VQAIDRITSKKCIRLYGQRQTEAGSPHEAVTAIVKHVYTVSIVCPPTAERRNEPCNVYTRSGCRGGAPMLTVITHTDDIRGSKAFIRVCLCVFVCPHDRTKTAETTIAKLGTGIVHHDTSPNNIINIRSTGYGQS